MKIHLVLMLVLLAGTTLLNAKPNLVFKPEQIMFDTLSREDPIKIFRIQMSNLDKIEHKIREHTFTPNANNELSCDLQQGLIMQPKSTYKFEIKLDPSKAERGKFQSKLIIFLDDSSDKIIFNIIGTITALPPAKFQIQLYLPNITTQIGEDFILSVIVKKVLKNGAKINYVKGTIDYNASILAPASGGEEDKVEFGIRHSIFDANIYKKIEAGDTIASIPMLSALGDAEATKVQLSNVKFYYEDEPIDAEISILDGKVTLEGLIYQDGLPRLVSRISSNYYIFPPPNPITEDITLEVIYIGKATLKIYSLDGILVKDFSAELPVRTEKGTATIDIPVNVFPTYGAYIIRLSGENEFVSKMIIVK